MTIHNEIKIVKAYLDMFEALTPPEMLKESSPIISAMKNVCDYAEKQYREGLKKEMTDTLTKIMTGEKDEKKNSDDNKKH